MSPTLVRSAGIGVLAGIAIGLVAYVLMFAQIAYLPAFLMLITFVLYLFGYLALREYFSAMGYTGANGIITAMVIVFAISFACLFVLMVMAGGQPMMSERTGRAISGAGIGAGILGFAYMILGLAGFVLLVVLGFKSLAFARDRIGMGIWRMFGILILVMLGVLVLTVVIAIGGVAAGAPGLVFIAGILGFLTALIGLALGIVLGVGLIRGARDMESYRAG